VDPGQTITHQEDWFLFDHVADVKTDDDVKRIILPLVHDCQAQLASG
jgi:hypothetical protein